jgi:hypothetical protein
MVGPYLHVEMLEDSSPLTIFKMSWVGKFLGPLAYILKFISVGLGGFVFAVSG